MSKILIISIFIFVQIYFIQCFLSRPLELPRFLTKKSCGFDYDGCKCIVRLRGECCCKGLEVDQLPDNLTNTIRVLVMYNTSMTSISKSYFANYPNLEEIDIFSAPNLKHFDGTALKNLTHLRKFSLTWCKKLEEVSGTIMDTNLKIQSVILRDNGLKRMPGFEMTDDHKLDVEIDLSGNQIQYIGDGRVYNVRARTLRLNNNKIKEIAGYAFRGSSFVKLYLQNNNDLVDLSTDSFKEIKELHHLDLSDTAITQLPINGLKNLKSLTLRNVPTLKRLPSVLSFTQLETAHFTYPHHCCLFKYVDDVVEGENGMYKNNMKEIHHRLCKEKEGYVDSRKKRRVRKRKAEPTPDLMALFDPNWFFSEEETEDLEENYDDLPAFDSDQIGVSKCLSVAVDTSIRGFYQNITCTPQPGPFNPCENIVGYPLLRKAIWIVWILAILGNISVWITLGLAFERRMKVHYMFMINLSIGDLMTGVYLSILAIEDVLTSDEYYRHAVAWQTGFGCQIAGFFAVFASKLSIISMFLIAFEMAYNTRMGFYGRRLHPKAGWCLLIGAWCFALFMASLPFFGVSSYSTTSICLPLKVDDPLDRTYIIFGLMFNLMAFAGMAICYAFIIWMLKDPSTPSRAEDRAIITKMALLIGTDLVCWFPTLFFGLTAAMGVPLISISNAKVFLVFFFPINSFSNPFLYVFFTEVIQRKVKTKTMPVLRRITSSPGIALTSLSNFYHSQPPCKREEDMNSPEPNCRLQVTQTTSLASTPRGSHCSTQKTIDSIDALDAPATKRNGSSPRVSFQDNCLVYRHSADSNRRSFAAFKRISAIPEVSDLSEHSSESHHEHFPHKTETSKPSRFNWDRILGRNRKDSSWNQSGDSGRGSLTSTSTRETAERCSLIPSEDGETPPTCSHAQCITPPTHSVGKRKLTPVPPRMSPRMVNRRQSAPMLRPILTVTDCDRPRPLFGKACQDD